MQPHLNVIVITGAAALLASTLAAITGFGGAAILLPVLVGFFGMRAAVPILTLAQLVGNASRVWFNRRDVDYSIIGWFGIGAVPLALLGGAFFARAPLPLLTRMLGALLLLMVAWRQVKRGEAYRPTKKSFAVIGAISGFLSALLGSVGPLLAPFFLAYGLTKGAYVGTEALATVVMHLAKLEAYRQYALLDADTLLVGLALAPLMVAGSKLGKSIVDKLPERIFVLLVEAVLVVAGTVFLVRG